MVPAAQLQGDEWEERWGEHYCSGGRANKYADKWGKDGPNVWHERWGEDYDGAGGCTKYTDKARNLSIRMPSPHQGFLAFTLSKVLQFHDVWTGWRVAA